MDGVEPKIFIINVFDERYSKEGRTNFAFRIVFEWFETSDFEFFKKLSCQISERGKYSYKEGYVGFVDLKQEVFQRDATNYYGAYIDMRRIEPRCEPKPRVFSV